MSVRRRFSLLLCAPFLSPFAAVAASPADFVPSPGLYRIDTHTSSTMKLGGIHGQGQVQEDGATGDTRVSGEVAGVPKQAGSIKGEGPKTQCVRPVSSAAPLAGIDTGSACVAKGGAVENGAFVIRQTCAQDKLEITIRKIDKSTWEYKTDVLQSGNSPATQQSTESSVIAMLRNARAHAATEQDRKDLDKALVEYAGRSADEKVAPVPGMQSQAPGGMLVRRTVMLQKWTRIADKCDVPKK